MANIDVYLEKIMAAIYGEEVRGSIHDAIAAMNEEVSDFVQGELDETLTSATLPPPAKTVGEKMFTFRASVQNTDDVNDLKDPGWYNIPNANHPANLPDTGNGYRYILVLPNTVTKTFYQQIYINTTAHTIYTRQFYSSSWKTWVNAVSGFVDSGLTETGMAADAKAAGDAVAALNAEALVHRESLEAGADLDTITEPGWYIIGNSAAVVNGPNETGGHRLLICYNGNRATGFRYQLFYNFEAGTVHIRLYADGTFRSWALLGAGNISAAIGEAENAYFLRRPNIAAGESLNDMTLPGWYIIPTAVDVLDGPETAHGYRMVLLYTGTTPFANQLYLNRANGFTAFRTRTSTGWTAWNIISPGMQEVRRLTRTPERDKPNFDICHRGYSAEAPENSLLAYKLAAKYGYPWIETDIQFTADNVPVMLHDRNIANTARNDDGSAITGTLNIDSITYTQALTYDFGIKKGAQFAGTRVATLAEAVELLRKLSLSAILHFKETVTGAERRKIIYDTVQAAGMTDSVVFMSGNKTTLSAIAAEVENCRVCLSNDPAFCDDTLVPYLQSLQLNGNEVWTTSNPSLYPDLIAYVDAAQAAGFTVTARADNAAAADAYLRPWAHVFITNGAAQFKPSVYVREQALADVSE